MTVRLVGIVIGLLVAGYYAIQLQRIRTGRGNALAAANPGASTVIAAGGLVIGLGVAAWWFLS